MQHYHNNAPVNTRIVGYTRVNSPITNYLQKKLHKKIGKLQNWSDKLEDKVRAPVY